MTSERHGGEDYVIHSSQHTGRGGASRPHTAASQTSGITVVGTGTATTAIDRVTVTLGVESVRADAGEAFRAAAAAVTEVLAALADHGVDARSVRTADLSLGPHSEFRGGEQRSGGYRAAQRLVVTLEGLSTISPMLTDVTARVGDALRIDELRLSAANPREAAADARTAAMIDAREKAMSLAVLAGRPLGAVVRIDPEPERGTRPVAMVAYSTRQVADMPVAAADTGVTVSLRVHFAWAD